MECAIDSFHFFLFCQPFLVGWKTEGVFPASSFLVVVTFDKEIFWHLPLTSLSVNSHHMLISDDFDHGASAPRMKLSTSGPSSKSSLSRSFSWSSPSSCDSFAYCIASSKSDPPTNISNWRVILCTKHCRLLFVPSQHNNHHNTAIVIRTKLLIEDCGGASQNVTANCASYSSGSEFECLHAHEFFQQVSDFSKLLIVS